MDYFMAGNDQPQTTQPNQAGYDPDSVTFVILAITHCLKSICLHPDPQFQAPPWSQHTFPFQGFLQACTYFLSQAVQMVWNVPVEGPAHLMHPSLFCRPH